MFRFTIILLLLPLFTFSQQENDALDYINKSKRVRTVNLDSTYYYISMALKEPTKIKNVELLNSAKLSKAIILIELGKTNNSKTILEEIIVDSSKISLTTLGLAYNAQGKWFELSGNLVAA